MTVVLLLRNAAAPTPPSPGAAATTAAAVFPATTTFPNTNVYPGQGTAPIARARVSFSDASVATPVWTEVDHRKFRSFSVSRGRESELQDFDAGTATVVLDNRDRAYDPLTNASVRPMNRVWLYEEFSGEVHDLYTGYVESWDQEWPGIGISDAIATASCVDETKVLSLAHLPTTSPPRNDYGEVIAFDNPSAYWPMGRLDFDASKIGAEIGDKDFVSILSGDGVPINSLGAQTPGAIIGDERQSVGMLLFFQDAAWSTGELLPEDELGMCSLSAFTVEFWLAANSFGTSTDTVIRGPLGRLFNKFTVDVTTAGALSCTVRNHNETAFTVSGGSILADQTKYHCVLRLFNGTLGLWINNALQASTAFSGITNSNVNLTRGFTGIITVDPNTSADWRIGGDGANTGYWIVDELAFYRFGLSTDRISAHYQAGTARGFRAARSGQRIGDVLDTAISRAPRTISTGARFVIPSYMVGQAPLDELRKARDADNVDSGFFISASGGFVYKDTFTANQQSSLVTVGDSTSEIPYLDIDVDYSDSFITNEWNVTRKNGNTQTASNAVSITSYYTRSQSVSDVPVPGDSDAATIAAALLAKYKDPLYRVRRVTFSTADQATAVAIFRRDLMEKITVKRTPPGGGSRISQDLLIEKIELSGANDGQPWIVSWGVSTA